MYTNHSVSDMRHTVLININKTLQPSKSQATHNRINRRTTTHKTALYFARVWASSIHAHSHKQFPNDLLQNVFSYNLFLSSQRALSRAVPIKHTQATPIIKIQTNKLKKILKLNNITKHQPLYISGPTGPTGSMSNCTQHLHNVFASCSKQNWQKVLSA